MRQTWMTFVFGLQTGIMVTFIAMFFIAGPAPQEGGCSCGKMEGLKEASVALDGKEICGLPETKIYSDTEVRTAADRPSSLGEYILTAAWRCRPCGYYCRCGAICRCRK